MLFRQLGSDLQPWYPPRTDTSTLLYVVKLPLGRAGKYLLGWGLLAGAWSLRRGVAPSAASPGPERLRLWGLLAVSAAPAALAWVLQVYAGAFEGRYLVAMAFPLLPATCLPWSRMFLGEPLRYALPWRTEPLTISGATQQRIAWVLLAVAFVGQHLDRARWLRPSSPAREFASLVEQHGLPGDLIWIFPAPYASSFNFHFKGPQVQLAFPFRERVTRVDWPALRDREHDPDLINGFLAQLEGHLDGGGRIWALFVEGLPLDASWPFGEGPSPSEASRLARAELQVHRRALRVLYTRAKVAGWWDRPHHDYHEGITLVLFAPPEAASPPDGPH
jgi:hypothetical protein